MINKKFFYIFFLFFSFSFANQKNFSILDLIKIKNINEQITIIKKVKNKSFNLQLYLTKLYIKEKKFSKAKEILRNLMNISNSPYIYELYYQIYNENREKQLLILQEALESSNKYDQTLNYLIIKTAKELGKKKLAIYYALQYLKMYPADLKINYELVNILVSEGKINLAKEILENLLLYYPNNTEIKKKISQLNLF